MTDHDKVLVSALGDSKKNTADYWSMAGWQTSDTSSSPLINLSYPYHFCLFLLQLL